MRVIDRPGIIIEDRHITGPGPLLLVNCHGAKIRRVTVDTPREGIFLRDCYGVEIEDVDVRASRTGLYCSRTRDVTVRGSTFFDCGNGGLAWWKREAIALDGAQDTLVEDVKVIECDVGIATYSNCGEHGSAPRQPATRNEIRHCTFDNGHIGIWFGSRQWRDMRGWDCTRAGGWEWDVMTPKQPFPKWLKPRFPYFGVRSWIVPDVVYGNTETGNEFGGVSYPVIDNQLRSK